MRLGADTLRQRLLTAGLPEKVVVTEEREKADG